MRRTFVALTFVAALATLTGYGRDTGRAPGARAAAAPQKSEILWHRYGVPHVFGTDAVRVITWGPLDAAGTRYPQHGETWIGMIEFTTPIKAYGLMSYGNSRQRGSEHRSDQLAHLSNHEFRELWLQRKQIEANVSQVTDLKP